MIVEVHLSPEQTMSNTEQSFLSKEVPPAFLRVIQMLILGFIAMVMGQLTRVNWQSNPDLGIVLIVVLLMFVGILLTSMLKK